MTAAHRSLNDEIWNDAALPMLPTYAQPSAWNTGVPPLTPVMNQLLLRMVAIESQHLTISISEAREELGAARMEFLSLLSAVVARLMPKHLRTKSVWRYNAIIARVSARLVPHEKNAAICGLLHASGSVLFSMARPEEAQLLSQRCSATGISFEEVAHELGIDSENLSQRIWKHWELGALPTPACLVAVDIARWLVALKRVRDPSAMNHRDPEVQHLRNLGLDAAGMVSVLIDLGDLVDSGRRLADEVLRSPSAGRPLH